MLSDKLNKMTFRSLLALACTAIALVRCGCAVATSDQFAAMTRQQQFKELGGILMDSHASDGEVSSTIQRLCGGLLGTDQHGWSCLMLVLTQSHIRARSGRIPQLLLRTAGERGELRELLEITDPDDGGNVFHFVRTAAQLRLLLAALHQARLCTADCPQCAATRDAVRTGLPKDAPVEIGDLVSSFLSSTPDCQLRRHRLLNKVLASRFTPLTKAMHRKNLAMVKLLVEAGADPKVKTDYYRGTALDIARRVVDAQGPFEREVPEAIAAYLERLPCYRTDVTEASR